MKTLLLSLILICNLMAITVEDTAWVLDAQTSMEKAYQKAKTEKKDLLMLLIIESSCEWCEKMVHRTLRDENIRSALSDMVIVVADFNSPEAKEHNATLTPSIYFIDVKTKKTVYSVIGYEKPGSFMIDIVSAKDKIE